MAAKRNVRRVKLEDLFRWKKELPIRDESGNVVLTIYQRVVGDNEHEKTRLSAIRKSREIRLALRNPESDEYMAMMESLAQYGKEQQINILMIERFESIYNQAKNKVNTPFPKAPPSDSSLEEIEEYEHAVDEYNEQVGKATQDLINQATEEERKRFEVLSEEQLLEACHKALENQICSNVLNSRFRELLAYYGTYEDANCTIRYFKNLQEFDELAVQVKEQLITGYHTLTLPQEELKN